MKHTFLGKALVCGLLSLALAACGHSDHDGHDHDHEGHDHASEEAHGHEGHDHGHEGEENHGAGEIVMSPEKAKAAGIVVEAVAADNFSEVIATSGRVLLSAADEATVVATQPGIVTMTKAWTQGMPVSVGTPLFSISQSKLPEGDLATRAKIDLETAKREFDRVQKLYDSRLATAAEYETAKNAYENARLTASALANGGNGSVSSPKSGYVLQCLVKDGDYVEVGTPLMTVTSTKRMRLQADLPIRNFGDISRIISANFRLPQNETLYRLETLGGRIVSHSRVAEGNSAYVPVIFEFDNAPGVVAGSFAEIYLIGNPRPGIISVPKSALTEEQGLFYVYIQEDEDCYRKRLVTKGATDGQRVEIKSGLKAGDRIVTANPMAVKMASMSGSIPGHTHEH
ncbi:MAG: efflux RND transporter periplasmic adaptor subunit [Muribaculaceae bacterium]|nr:efflux RND transporter periplasmic adaptor subunit [Muribaculaceae bacterium]